MDLYTGRILRVPRVQIMPITPQVIQQVENLAERQKIKSFKIKNRRGVLIYDSDWLAGVDYEDDEQMVTTSKTNQTKTKQTTFWTTTTILMSKTSTTTKSTEPVTL